MGYRNYSTAKGHIVDVNGTGDFTTIGAALTAAVSGQTIFIRPGTYTENPTLKPGVDICAFECDAMTPNVIINGTCTLSTAGIVTISGIQLQTNSNFLLVVSGTVSSEVILTNCNLNILNNTGISFTSSGGGAIVLNYCQCNIGTTGITFMVATGNGGTTLNYTQVGNGGASVTPTTVASSGTFNGNNSFFALPISSSSTASFTWYYTQFQAINTTCVTTAGSVTSTFSYCNFASGSASAISIGTGTGVQLYNSRVESSNTNAITGAGTLTYTPVNFTGTSSLVNTTTIIPKTIGPFITMPQQPAFSANAANQPAVTGDGTLYTVTFGNSTQFDQDTNFSSPTFTAPTAGKYLFCAYVTCSGVTGAVTQAQIRLVTTAQTYTFLGSDPAALAANAYGFNFSQVASMSAGDTATVAILFSGAGTKVISVTGANTYFSGVKVA